MFRDDFSNYYYPMMPVYPMMPGMPSPPAQPMPKPAPAPTPTPAPPVTLPPDFEFQPGPPVESDILYTQGYLKTQIGRYVKIDFLIGTNMIVDREGTLLDVGISYVILREPETDDLLLCDIYSIKFVKIFY